VLTLARGLTPVDLQAIADLEARTVEVDGGRLKLEWGVLNARTGRDVEDLLWWDGDQLLGFWACTPSLRLPPSSPAWSIRMRAAAA
jgi:hypothetical protein